MIKGENPGSKLNKAQKLNIKILNENEFIKLIDNWRDHINLTTKECLFLKDNMYREDYKKIHS